EPQRRRARAAADAHEALGPILRVTAEQFVASVARKHDLHVPAGKLREQEKWDLGRFSDRLVSVPREARQRAQEIFASDDELVMVGAVSLGDETSPPPLIVDALAEPDCERCHGTGPCLAHQT